MTKHFCDKCQREIRSGQDASDRKYVEIKYSSGTACEEHEVCRDCYVLLTFWLKERPSK